MPAHDKSSDRARAIDTEHKHLRAMLHDIQQAGILELIPLLAKLRELLVDHFATEEGDEGLPAITNRQPQYFPRLNEIFDEHRAFLQRLDTLAARAQACAREKKEVLNEVRAFAHDLHEHEAKENELLGDVFYTDLGGGS